MLEVQLVIIIKFHPHCTILLGMIEQKANFRANQTVCQHHPTSVIKGLEAKRKDAEKVRPSPTNRTMVALLATIMMIQHKRKHCTVWIRQIGVTSAVSIHD